jgi:hypothetical protein
MGLYSGLSFGEPIDDSIAETEEDTPRRSLFPRTTSGSRALAPSDALLFVKRQFVWR